MKSTNKTRNKRVTRWTWVLVGVGCVLGGLTWADVPEKLLGKKQELKIELESHKVVPQADGRESLEQTEIAFPGEIIQYDAHYRNQSEGVLRRVSPTLPIPEGMVFVSESAHPKPSQASLDGKTFQTIPLKRQVQGDAGALIEVEIPATEYRALRWHLGDMAAGASATVSARTRVLGSNTP